MYNTQAIQQHFGSAAPHYERYAALQRSIRRHAMEMGRSYWPVGSRLLDIGAGTGEFSAMAERAGTRWQVFNVDIAFGMCAQAARRCSAINANAEILPFATASADGVFSSLMLQWVNRPANVFSEIARVVRIGGYAVIATLVEGTLFELKHAFSNVDSKPHVNAFAPAHRVLADAENAGLSLVSAEQKAIMEYYPDVVALMHALQIIGASNSHQHRARGMMTPRKCAALERQYAAFATSQGLPATWQVLFMVLEH